MEVSDQLHVPAALPPGKRESGTQWQEAGWALEPVWTQYRRQKLPSIFQNNRLETEDVHASNSKACSDQKFRLFIQEWTWIPLYYGGFGKGEELYTGTHVVCVPLRPHLTLNEC
jgi:hypothetical protein